MKAHEILAEGRAHPVIVVDVQPEYSGMNDGNENSVFTQIIQFVNKQTCLLYTSELPTNREV